MLTPGNQKKVSCSGAKCASFKIGLPPDFGRIYNGKKLTPLYNGEICIYVEEKNVDKIKLKFSNYI